MCQPGAWQLLFAASGTSLRPSDSSPPELLRSSKLPAPPCWCTEHATALPGLAADPDPDKDMLVAHMYCPPPEEQRICLYTVFAPHSQRAPAKTSERGRPRCAAPSGHPVPLVPLVVAARACGRAGAAWTAPQLIIHVLPESAARHLQDTREDGPTGPSLLQVPRAGRGREPWAGCWRRYQLSLSVAT